MVKCCYHCSGGKSYWWFRGFFLEDFVTLNEGFLCLDTLLLLNVQLRFSKFLKSSLP